MTSARRFPISVASRRCRGTDDCTCAFCQDFAATPAGTAAAREAAAPRRPSLADEAAGLRAAVHFAAEPEYLGRERAAAFTRAAASGAIGPNSATESSRAAVADTRRWFGPDIDCCADGAATVEDRTAPTSDGAAPGAAGGGREAAGDAERREEMGGGLTFVTGMRGDDASPVPSLLRLCVAEVGRYLPHLMAMDSDEFDLRRFLALLPSHARLALTAIARRRGLLSDWLLEALVDDTWHIVDLCGADVSDDGLCHVAQTCPNLVAVDMGVCDGVSPAALTRLLKACPSLQVLRLGGSPCSNRVAQAAVKWMLPQPLVKGTGSMEPCGRGEGEAGVGERWEGAGKGDEGEADNEDEGSWEEVEERLEQRVPSLRWLVWPQADPKSAELLASKCPRIQLNPTPASLPPPFPLTTLPSAILSRIPLQAFPSLPLDSPHVLGIPPAVWEVGAGGEEEGEEEEVGEEGEEGGGLGGEVRKGDISATGLSAAELPVAELSIAERFRLAYEARDERLAPKRAKNQRQRTRRAERDRASADMAIRARLLAALAAQSLRL